MHLQRCNSSHSPLTMEASSDKCLSCCTPVPQMYDFLTCEIYSPHLNSPKVFPHYITNPKFKISFILSFNQQMVKTPVRFILTWDPSQTVSLGSQTLWFQATVVAKFRGWTFPFLRERTDHGSQANLNPSEQSPLNANAWKMFSLVLPCRYCRGPTVSASVVP